MPSSSAYLLVSHGSRDPRPQAAMTQLATLIRQKIQAPVETATLECSPLALHEQIQQFGQTLTPHSSIQIVPLFLLPGMHVMEDIPSQVKIAQRSHPGTIAISPHLGTHPGLKNLLTSRLDSQSAHILLSHGSRRSGGNQSVEPLAKALNAVPAYWLVAPSLETRLQELASQGHAKVTILPYFLFPGGITDAIAQSVEQLSLQFPNLHLTLTAPLEVSDTLVNLLVDLILQPCP
ncbi:sirohydrochlorin chelatase [Phormidesmis sp. 146-35]